MKSGWVDSEAQAAIDRYARDGISRDLALRVYTTRLLGRDPKFVLHGGGNTSLKTTMPDLLGEEAAVLCVKGSGSDMAAHGPAGLSALALGWCCRPLGWGGLRCMRAPQHHRAR